MLPGDFTVSEGHGHPLVAIIDIGIAHKNNQHKNNQHRFNLCIANIGITNIKYPT
jgi:hypothetical protein